MTGMCIATFAIGREKYEGSCYIRRLDNVQNKARWKTNNALSSGVNMLTPTASLGVESSNHQGSLPSEVLLSRREKHAAWSRMI